MTENLKLFKIKVNTKTNMSRDGRSYYINYVLASDPTQAYNKLRQFLDKNDIGYENQREMKSIKLIADSDLTTKLDKLLFL